MIRLSGVDLPNKKIFISLTYIKGIGLASSCKILSELNIDTHIKALNLTEDDILRLRNALSSYLLEGDLQRKVSQDIRRLMDINCYRGIRHKKKLPVRGQRTHTNARTKRGKRISIAGKKKVTK
jgi:small subunit ribosomal protein S13